MQDVAIMDEVGLVDHHREMRLDIEDMTYEASSSYFLSMWIVDNEKSLVL